MESLIISPPKKNIGNYECTLPCQHVPVRIHRISQKRFLCVAGSSGFLTQLLRILYSIHFYKLWSFLYPARKFAGDVPDFFLKNFPKDDWSEKPNCSAISFTVRSVKTSRRLASL